ncbi:glycosyltransferase family 39 protein, partial [Saprospiraceae bacterium]|nr:glycosyltransferase family 39 protein [Saprospiraceae bacterium]
MNSRFFWGILFLLVIARFLHFGTLIDEPHDWRQSDTAFYIYDFYINGIDLLEPAVCWMGNYERVIFEFPLPEAIVAFLYQLFGEHLPIARFIFYLFFIGALYFFHQIVQLIFGKKTAQWATLVYLSLPLSWFYSRAIHIDFSSIMAAHAMLYFYLKGVSKRHFTALIWSSLWASLVFLIKVPYAFYLALPMLAFAWKENAIGWMLKRAVVFVVPLFTFLLWQQYVYKINGQAPDWNYILHYRKFDNNHSWYFGSWARRIDFNAWKILAKRGVLEVIGLGGIL